jgi:hypothetical protein
MRAMTIIAVCVLALAVFGGRASAGSVGKLRVACSSDSKHVSLSGIPQTAVDGRLTLWTADGTKRAVLLKLYQGHITSLRLIAVPSAGRVMRNRVVATVWVEVSRPAVEPLPFRLFTVKAHAACT